MSHFLKPREVHAGHRLGTPRAAVKVLVRPHRTLEVQAGIVMANGDAQFVSLPPDVSVVGSDGKAIKPSPGALFLISLETIDPYHLLVQVDR